MIAALRCAFILSSFFEFGWTLLPSEVSCEDGAGEVCTAPIAASAPIVEDEASDMTNLLQIGSAETLIAEVMRLRNRNAELEKRNADLEQLNAELQASYTAKDVSPENLDVEQGIKLKIRRRIAQANRRSLRTEKQISRRTSHASLGNTTEAANVCAACMNPANDGICISNPSFGGECTNPSGTRYCNDGALYGPVMSCQVDPCPTGYGLSHNGRWANFRDVKHGITIASCGQRCDADHTCVAIDFFTQHGGSCHLYSDPVGVVISSSASVACLKACRDNTLWVDKIGMVCADWVGTDCTRLVEKYPYYYQQQDEDDLLSNCCGSCQAFTTTTTTTTTSSTTTTTEATTTTTTTQALPHALTTLAYHSYVGKGWCVDSSGKNYKGIADTYPFSSTDPTRKAEDCEKACAADVQCIGFEIHKQSYLYDGIFTYGCTILFDNTVASPHCSKKVSLEVNRYGFQQSICGSYKNGNCVENTGGTGPITNSKNNNVLSNNPWEKGFCYKKEYSFEYEEVFAGTQIGYCQPSDSNGGGELCNALPSSNACQGAGSNYYLPASCDASCAKKRCDSEPACTGFTKKWDPALKVSTFKLKTSMVSPVNWGYRCYQKRMDPDKIRQAATQCQR